MLPPATVAHSSPSVPIRGGFLDLHMYEIYWCSSLSYQMAWYLQMSWTHYHVCFKSPLDCLKYLTQCHVSGGYTVLFGQQQQQQRFVDGWSGQMSILPKDFSSTAGCIWRCRTRRYARREQHLFLWFIQTLSAGSEYLGQKALPDSAFCWWWQRGVCLLMWSGLLPGNKVNSSIWSSAAVIAERASYSNSRSDIWVPELDFPVHLPFLWASCGLSSNFFFPAWLFIELWPKYSVW